ncbi:MAG: DUF3127 domain-containing protein [Flavobacteriaceae bacterium]|nr:DUF3127 domain-containing protein [Flavobacteriaceae bacterium]
MQLTAKLIQVLPLQTGTSKNGEWKKQDIIVETDGQYPKKIYVSIWGDKINPNDLKIGNDLQIDFNIESREYNNKWYTEVRAWRVKVEENKTTPIPTSEDDLDFLDNEDEDKLPF